MNGWPWPAVFAHRCGGALAPENTLEGLDVAARFCGGVEFDVMLSADGTPHLIHDETLERTTSGRGFVAEHGDLALSTLDAGGWFSPRFAGARIPRLVEAAVRCRQRGLAANVEIKPSAGTEVRTGEVVARCAREAWRGAPPPLLSSFSEDALAAARDAAPELPRGLLVEAVPRDWLARCHALDVVALHADTRQVTAALAAAVKDAGLWLVLYTENAARAAATRFGWGADCVITDRPDRVRAPASRP